MFAYPLGVLELVVNRIIGLLQVSLDQSSNKRCQKEVQSSTSLKVHHLTTYFRILDYYVHFYTPRWVDNGFLNKIATEYTFGKFCLHKANEAFNVKFQQSIFCLQLELHQLILFVYMTLAAHCLVPVHLVVS